MRIFSYVVMSFIGILIVVGCTFKKNPYYDKVAQMIMVGFNGTDLTSENPIYANIVQHHIGGVILFNKNVENPLIAKNIRDYAQVKQLIHDLQNISSVPLFVAVDQEGGKVARLSEEFGVSTKSAWELGRINDLKQTKSESLKTAKVLRDLGFNVNFSPCVDVMLNLDSPIIAKLERSFSKDPNDVALHAEEVIKAHQANMILPVLKHFPGHGSAKGDTHAGFVDITHDYQESELIPYQRLLPKYPFIGVMVAHVFNQKIDPVWPLSLSKQNISDTLRGKLNFNGLVFSDDLQMGALTNSLPWSDIVIQAVNAGNDILVIGNNLHYDPQIVQKTINIILEAIDKGKIDPKTIDRSYERIMLTKSKMKMLTNNNP